MAPKRRKTGTQQRMTQHALQLLKKPMELIDKQIAVPGEYWQGRQSAEEMATLYLCTVRDFVFSHKFLTSAAPEAAVNLQEMGVTGTGSTELGDASGEIFWMPYQPVFLQYYYATFPNELAAPTNSPVIVLDPPDSPDSPASPSSPDVVPGFPHVRLSRAPVMAYYSIVSDKLVELGPRSGQYKASTV